MRGKENPPFRMKCAIKRQAIFLFSEISLLVPFELYSELSLWWLWMASASQFNFSMSFHQNMENPVVPMKVSSDSELVRREGLVEMYWKKWTKGMETWILFWSPDFQVCVFVHNPDSGILPFLIYCGISYPSCGTSRVLSGADARGVCHLRFLWRGAETGPGSECRWEPSRQAALCTLCHGVGRLRLINRGSCCQPDPSVTKLCLSLSLNGFLSYWWWLPRSVILLGVSRWWHPNSVTPSTCIKCPLCSTVWLPWNRVPIGNLRSKFDSFPLCSSFRMDWFRNALIQ